MKLSVVLRCFGSMVGLASTIWFGLQTFVTQVFYGHGVYFYEPDLGMATLELVMIVVGIIGGFFTLHHAVPDPVITKITHKLTEQERFSLGIQRKIVRVKA